MSIIHSEAFIGFTVFFGIGFLTHVAERLWPLRAYFKPKALGIDIVGYVVSIAGSIGFLLVFPHVAARMHAVPGLGSIQWISHAVSARLPWPIALLVFVIVLDFLHYVGHRLLHTPFLWHTHAAHHSVEHLYWFGGNRASPIHVSMLLAGGQLLAWFWPIHGGERAFIAQSIVYAGIQHFNHANLRWRLGFLGWLIVVPRHHFVHHGADPKLNNSNFGFLFTIWDRMFGTYRDPDSAGNEFPIGLNYEVATTRMFIGLPPGRTS